MTTDADNETTDTLPKLRDNPMFFPAGDVYLWADFTEPILWQE